MAETITFTATRPTSGTATARLVRATLPAVERRHLGVKLIGNRKTIIVPLDGGGPVEEDAYIFEVVVDRDYEDDAAITQLRTDSAAWFALQGRSGAVEVVQEDWEPDEYDSMVLYRVEPSPTLLEGAAAMLTLYFARYIP